ncbi:MAG: M3 family metallopeptidase, partial [Syntrophothermus sp.]
MLDKLLTTIQSGGALLTRDQIEPQYKWDLTHIYNDEAIWEKDFKWVEESLPNYKKFEGQLENKLLECIKFSEEVEIKLERLYLYAFLSKDSDTKVTKYLAMEERVKSMYSRLMAASSFINPEILEIPEDKLNEIINSSNEMKVYKHKLEELLRNKAHTLSKREEEILSMAVDITTIPYSTFSILNNAEMQFPKILNEEGNEIEVSHGRYGKALYSKDRSYRERMYKSYYKPYKEYVNTLTTLFNGNLKTKIFNAKVRHYNSTREAALFHNNIPVEVYDNLIDSVNQNLAPLHRWASLKKKILKLDELHPYDVYVS